MCSADTQIDQWKRIEKYSDIDLRAYGNFICDRLNIA